MGSEITSFKSMISNLDSALLEKIPALKSIKSFLGPIEKVQAGGGEQLKEALKTSGLFLESKLKGVIGKAEAAGVSGKKEMAALILKEIGGDLKGALLKFKGRP